MVRILAAHPGEAEPQKHLLHVRSAGETLHDASRRAKSGRFNADARFECRGGEANILLNHLTRRLALDQPGSTPKAKLNVLRSCRQHIHMVVGMIADRMAGLNDLLE